MRTNENMINQLPILLRRLSNGESLSIRSLHMTLGIPIRTLQANFKEVLIPLFPDDIKYDHSTKNFFSNKNFLSETLLTPDELITMKLLDNLSDSLGKRFSLSRKRLFTGLKKELLSKFLKNQKWKKFFKMMNQY